MNRCTDQCAYFKMSCPAKGQCYVDDACSKGSCVETPKEKGAKCNDGDDLTDFDACNGTTPLTHAMANRFSAPHLNSMRSVQSPGLIS